MEARRREPFELEPGERTEPRLVETAGTGGPRLDLVRWGPTWAGFFVTLATTAFLILLGTAVGLTSATAGAAPPPAPGTPAAAGISIWAPVSLFIALLAGGYVMMRLSATGGQFISIVHGVLLWAVTVVLGSLFAALGLSAIFGGALPGMVGGAPGTVPGTVLPESTGAVWGTIVGLIIGLGAAMLGAWLGDQARRPERPERVTRAAA